MFLAMEILISDLYWEEDRVSTAQARGSLHAPCQQHPQVNTALQLSVWVSSVMKDFSYMSNSEFKLNLNPSQLQELL